jgi:hypothetical protein
MVKVIPSPFMRQLFSESEIQEIEATLPKASFFEDNEIDPVLDERYDAYLRTTQG